MSVTTYMLNRSFTPLIGLDRKYCQELWHVVGIDTDVNLPKWKRSNTNQTVYAFLPMKPGDPHPDPGLSSAICVHVRLVAGPLRQGDGSAEAIVAVTFDSDRRWGGAFQEGTTTSGEDYPIHIPTWARGQSIGGGRYSWTETSFPYFRARIIRQEVRDATNITEDQKANIFSYIGMPFKIYGIPYIMRSPRIVRIKTNQTLLTYVFESSSAIRAFAAGTPTGSDVAIPALGFLEEYVRNYDAYPPRIETRSVESYGPMGDPTYLPFWNARLV